MSCVERVLAGTDHEAMSESTASLKTERPCPRHLLPVKSRRGGDLPRGAAGDDAGVAGRRGMTRDGEENYSDPFGFDEQGEKMRAELAWSERKRVCGVGGASGGQRAAHESLGDPMWTLTSQDDESQLVQEKNGGRDVAESPEVCQDKPMSPKSPESPGCKVQDVACKGSESVRCVDDSAAIVLIEDGSPDVSRGRTTGTHEVGRSIYRREWRKRGNEPLKDHEVMARRSLDGSGRCQSAEGESMKTTVHLPDTSRAKALKSHGNGTRGSKEHKVHTKEAGDDRDGSSMKRMSGLDMARALNMAVPHCTGRAQLVQDQVEVEQRQRRRKRPKEESGWAWESGTDPPGYCKPPRII